MNKHSWLPFKCINLVSRSLVALKVRVSYKSSLEMYILCLITVSQKVYSASFLFLDVFNVVFAKIFSIAYIKQCLCVNSFIPEVGNYSSSCSVPIILILLNDSPWTREKKDYTFHLKYNTVMLCKSRRMRTFRSILQKPSANTVTVVSGNIFCQFFANQKQNAVTCK